jgi:hypothetical protein
MGIESPHEPWPSGVECCALAIAELPGLDERTVMQGRTRNSAKLFDPSKMT